MSQPFDMVRAERFRALVAHRFGLQFEADRLAWLDDVLQRAVDASRLGCERYLAQLAQPGDDRATDDRFGALVQELTVPETYFFRNPDQFRALQQQVLPALLRQAPAARRVRVLSAGCASGEEAYSIAIMLRGLMPDASWTLSVHGIDLNPAMIEKARSGRYVEWSLRGAPAAQRERWFRRDGPDFVLDAEARAGVSFELRNLCADDARFWQPNAYDIVFCRNVLMYFTPDEARGVVARIAGTLAPQGHLFLGHAETLRRLSDDFELRHTHDTFYYQRKADGRAAPLVAPPPSGDWVQAIGQAADRIRTLTSHGAAAAPDAAPRPTWPLGEALELLGQERFAQALDVLQALPAESGHDPDVALLQAVLLTHTGQFSLAEAACRRLLATDRTNAGAHHVLAQCCDGAGDPAGAAECERLAAWLDPGFAMPRLHLGLLAQRAGDMAGARRELEQALALLQGEAPWRLRLFGGGFARDALLALCRTQLQACGAGS
jgi:chemotaxis protein methyltransferase CheR